MSEHLSAENLEQYRNRTLVPPDLLRVDDHLRACESCRAKASADAQLAGIVRTVDESLRSPAIKLKKEHLSYKQIAALVDGELDRAGREIAESHLELCSLCSEEVKDLRSFSASLKVTESEKTVSKESTQVVPVFREKIGPLRRFFALPSPPQFASVVAVLLLAVGVSFWWWQMRPRPAVVQITPSAAPIEPPSPGLATPGPNPPGEASPEILLALNDGGKQVSVDAQGTIKGLENLSPEAQVAVKKALTSERVEKPDILSKLTGKGGTLMGPEKGERFSLLNPVGVVVREDRPRLTWQPLPEASGYTVTILDEDLVVVGKSPLLGTVRWTPTSPLKRGEVYKWQVSAVKGDHEIVSPAAPAPEARFRILDRNMNDQLRRLERSEGRSHLARGVLYAQAGLLDDAERELRALVAANPKAEVARKLLRSLRR